MAPKWIEQVTGSFEDKKRWKQYKARKAQLPTSYRTAIDGIERYFMYAGAVVNGDAMMQMFEDLADLIDGAVVNQTPIRDIVGADPVDFAETFIANYSDSQWVNKERKRLTDAINKSVDET